MAQQVLQLAGGMGAGATVVWGLTSSNARRYYACIMIRNFLDREAERIFEREFSRRLPPDIQRRARIKLEILDAAEDLFDLQIPPSNRLEKLTGDRADQYSIRVNQQWRICFRWRNGDVYDVEIVDYH
jgi:proteic killer suppression protein